MSLSSGSLNIQGKILTPGCTEYEQARKLYNGMVDKRPAIIAKCADAADGPT
jgi:hypothetical protein